MRWGMPRGIRIDWVHEEPLRWGMPRGIRIDWVHPRRPLDVSSLSALIPRCAESQKCRSAEVPRCRGANCQGEEVKRMDAS